MTDQSGDGIEREPWHCEECGETQTGIPAATESFPGPDGDVELWFCEECARHERDTRL